MKLVEDVKNRKFPLEFPGHWLGNQWSNDGGSDFKKDSLNPNDGTPLISVFLSKKTLAQAIDISQDFLDRHDRLDNAERLEILRRVKASLADLKSTVIDSLRIELGKPHWEAELDFDATMKYLQWTIDNEESLFQAIAAPAQIGCSNGKIGLQPIGVTLGFLPFSTPLSTFIHYLTGCVVSRSPLTMVVSGNSAITGLVLASMLEKVDMPKGFINILFGNFSGFKFVLSDKRVKAVLYTGSLEHCDIIRRESRSHLGRQLVLQSGGKNAVIVHSTADIDQAVRIVAMGTIRGNGQLCTSTSRVFVYSNLAKEFNDSLKAFMQSLKISRTDKDAASDPDVGPLYSAKAVDKFLRYQTMAHRESKEELIWGESVDRESNGYFVRPGVHYLKSFDAKSAFQSNVLFGPHVSIYDYEELDLAIEQVNTTTSPFVVSFVGDPEILTTRRYKFYAPNVMLNMPTVEMHGMMPVAGRLNSGDYRYNGPGLSAILSYPQIVQQPQDNDFLKTWRLV